MIKKVNYLKWFDLQMFADADGDGKDVKEVSKDGSKTYTEEEYQKLKSSFDTTSTELARLKKEAKAKLSQEEQNAEAQKEKDNLLENYKKEILGIKMSKELLISGFDEKTCESLIDTYNKGDSVEFSKQLATNIKVLVENARKEEQTKFQQSGKIPPNGNTKKEDYSEIKNLVPKSNIQKENKFFK